MTRRGLLLGVSAGLVVGAAVALPQGPESAARLERVRYNHPGLVVDLGVGLWAWPLPMDYDGDGDLDLVVVCTDKPSNGVYFFENPGGPGPMPVFKPGVRLGPAASASALTAAVSAADCNWPRTARSTSAPPRPYGPVPR